MSDTEALYRLALQEGSIDPPGAAEALGWSRDRVRTAAQALVERALIRPVPDAECYVPASPDNAAEQIIRPLAEHIEAERRRFESMRQEIAKFALVYEEFSNSAGFSELEGVNTINEAIEEAARDSRLSVCTVQPGGGRSAEALEAAWPETKALLSRGVRMRTLYQHPAVFSGPTRAYVRRVVELGAEVRTTADLFDRLMIFDGVLAVIPGSTDRNTAVLVRVPAVVAFLAGVFDRTWDAARPFPTRLRSSQLDDTANDVRLTIAKLLASGETDEVIARRIGLSVRTCRAHIARLYEQFGARSRCQLGVRLSQSGLLDSADPL